MGGLPWRPRSDSEDGVNGEPLGVYRVEQLDGEPILRVSGQVYGALTSEEAFSDYHLQWPFRWGDRKWPPRLARKRDSGVLIHGVGRNGAFWNVWMRSLECQVQEGDCGDFIGLAGAAATVRVRHRATGEPLRYEREGRPQPGTAYVFHGPSQESPHGEWTTIDLYTIGQTPVFAVNGTPNMALFQTTVPTASGGREPLTRGRIHVQSEAAAIDYRRLRIRPLEAFPAATTPFAVEPSSRAGG